MELNQARTIAESLRIQMSPFCQRVEIAGSIRRQKDDVKDVELVCVPKWDEVPDMGNLFESATKRVNRLHQWALSNQRIQWIKTGTKEVVPWPIEPAGKYWRGLLLATGIKLDLFLCTPENWGTIMLIRTGSAEFSAAVMAHARRQGHQFDGGKLHLSGIAVETREEKDVFAALGLHYVEPANRTTARAVRALRGGKACRARRFAGIWNGENDSPMAQKEVRAKAHNRANKSGR